jgi:hypothetical protein
VRAVRQWTQLMWTQLMWVSRAGHVSTANGQGHTASGGKAMAYGSRAKGILSGVLDSGQ